MLVFGNYDCFVMQMLYVCVLCASCGSSQFCVLHDLQFGRGCLYSQTSWTTQHALSSDYLPIITTINIRHDHRLQQNRRTFTNYKKADWTQFTKDTESAFAQTTIPTNITHCQHNFYKHHTDGRQEQHTKG